MNKFKYYIIKYKKILIIITILSIILLLLFLNLPIDNSNEVIEIEQSNEINEKAVDEVISNETKMVKVDIKGYVNNPGVFELSNASRVIDAINAAGGLKEDANTDYLNLSKTLQDQMVIIVYSNSEISKFKKSDEKVIYIEKACNCPDNENDACISEEDVVNTIGRTEENSTTNNDSKTSSSTNKNQQTNAIVSINSGTLQELMTLTGIGESKAKAIIEYREKNNGFKTLEELMNVSGIGEKTYSKIKDRIKL